MADSENWIKQRAYELWEADGQPHGKHHDHWAQAKAEYDARGKAGTKSPAKGKSVKPDTKATKSVEEKPVKETKARSKKPSPSSKASTEPDVDKAASSKPVSAKPSKASKTEVSKAAAPETAPKRARKSQPA